MGQINWSELMQKAGPLVDEVYEPLPEGDYDLKISEASTKTTSTGKTMYSVKCQVQGGAYANRLVWDNLVISPESEKAMRIFFSQMRVLPRKRPQRD